MCGRFGYTLVHLKDGTQKWVRMVQEWENFNFAELEKSFSDHSLTEIHPGAVAPILLYQKNKRQLSFARWGVHPDWSPKLIFNTRSEKLFSSNVWEKSAKFHRCIVPCSHFYEWKSENGTKVKYKISPKSGEWFCFAGIWGINEDTKDSLPWFSILTQEGNSLMKSIHNSGGNRGRQPVHLTENIWSSWLDTTIQQESIIQTMILQYNSEFLTAEPENSEPMLF
ncbi:MAG: SOS response-associated peptidase family protein [Leptospira sp.]|nr:SOS response-associated peptidase family protein [Leptospira sp.]